MKTKRVSYKYFNSYERAILFILKEIVKEGNSDNLLLRYSEKTYIMEIGEVLLISDVSKWQKGPLVVANSGKAKESLWTEFTSMPFTFAKDIFKKVCELTNTKCVCERTYDNKAFGPSTVIILKYGEEPDSKQPALRYPKWLDRNSVDGALAIARHYGLEAEVLKCIENGDTPQQALKEWDL